MRDLPRLALPLVAAETIVARRRAHQGEQKGPGRPSSATGVMRSLDSDRFAVPRSERCSTTTVMESTTAVGGMPCLRSGRAFCSTVCVFVGRESTSDD